MCKPAAMASHSTVITCAEDSSTCSEEADLHELLASLPTSGDGSMAQAPDLPLAEQIVMIHEQRTELRHRLKAAEGTRDQVMTSHAGHSAQRSCTDHHRMRVDSGKLPDALTQNLWVGARLVISMAPLGTEWKTELCRHRKSAASWSVVCSPWRRRPRS